MFIQNGIVIINVFDNHHTEIQHCFDANFGQSPHYTYNALRLWCIEHIILIVRSRRSLLFRFAIWSFFVTIESVCHLSINTTDSLITGVFKWPFLFKLQQMYSTCNWCTCSFSFMMSVSNLLVVYKLVSMATIFGTEMYSDSCPWVRFIIEYSAGGGPISTIDKDWFIINAKLMWAKIIK